MRDSVVVVVRVRVGAEQYGPAYVAVPREEHEPSLVTRDNVERAVNDALSEIMDEGGI